MMRMVFTGIYRYELSRPKSKMSIQFFSILTPDHDVMSWDKYAWMFKRWKITLKCDKSLCVYTAIRMVYRDVHHLKHVNTSIRMVYRIMAGGQDSRWNRRLSFSCKLCTTRRKTYDDAITLMWMCLWLAFCHCWLSWVLFLYHWTIWDCCCARQLKRDSNSVTVPVVTLWVYVTAWVVIKQ